MANAIVAAEPGMPAPHVRMDVRAEIGRRAHTAASRSDSNIMLWRPPLRSADADIINDNAAVRARARDLVRNHPYAQQALRASRLGVVGRYLRYSCRPDHRFLGIDFEEATRWGQELERAWESYAHSLRFYSDASRRLTFSQQIALAHDCVFTDGENLAVFEWRKESKWKTCVQLVDVDRLANPFGRPDTARLKSGVYLDELSAPVGYAIRETHPGDVGLVGMQSPMAFREHQRTTPWGRPIIAHTFEQIRPGQTRGMSAFAPVVIDLKMGREYTEAALETAILQNSYAAVLTSQMNYQAALEVLGQMAPDQAAKSSIADLALENLEAAVAYHEDVKVRFNGSQIPLLWPGEKLELLSPGKSAADIGSYQSHATKSYAAGLGVNPVDVSQDYSNVNYSSAKMAGASAYRQYDARRQGLVFGLAMPHVAAFLEEAVFNGFPLPKGVSPLDFYDAQDALVRGTFLTQGAPHLDPLKEAQATKAEMENGTKTLQDACAEDGRDYLDVLDQLAREAQERAARGLPPVGVSSGLPPSGGEIGAADSGVDDRPEE